MKKKLLRMLLWFVIKLNIYLLWSKFHQAVFQRDRVSIPEFEDIDEVMDVVRQSKWTADKWWMAWDVIAHPEWAYSCYLKSGSLGDCDNYANFSAYCLRRLGNNKVWILSIQWFDTQGKFHGHNVCCYLDDTFQMWVISNGFHRPLPVKNQAEAINYFVRDGQILSWFVMDHRLKVTASQ